jgi:hypothetical protein
MEWFVNWWWVTVLGPIVLGVAMAYASIKRRRLTPSEKQSQHEAFERVYRPEE